VVAVVIVQDGHDLLAVEVEVERLSTETLLQQEI
jgi:hypothetical protein